jgi:hypothetical protein
MRNKNNIELYISRLDSIISRIKLNINRNEREEALELLEKSKEMLAQIQTYLNQEA